MWWPIASQRVASGVQKSRFLHVISGSMISKPCSERKSRAEVGALLGSSSVPVEALAKVARPYHLRVLGEDREV